MKNNLHVAWALFFVLVLCPIISGCFLLVIPGAALVGHTIQKGNEEYDGIIVNYGIKYKEYYQTMVIKNEIREGKGEEPEKILEFKEWIQTQPASEKEQKAVERYLRMNVSTQ